MIAFFPQLDLDELIDRIIEIGGLTNNFDLLVSSLIEISKTYPSHISLKDKIVDINIEIGDYVTYMYGTEVNIKRVLVLEKGFFFLTNEKVIIKDEQININNKSFITLDGHNETVPDKCVLVGSYLDPDPWVRIVHQNSIKYLTKKNDL